MDLSLEFHHPLKSKLSNNPQTNEDLVGKNTDNDEKVTVLDKLEHESNKVTIKGQFIEGSGAIATRDFGIDVTTSVHSSNDFGNITFSNTNIIHHKKGNNFIDMNDNKMFLGDGVEIVPHDFVKNFIENMNSRMNATTTTTSEPSSTDLQKKEAINSPVKTTTEASTEHPLEVTTVATKPSDTTTVISVQTTQNTITTTYSDGVTEKNNDQSTSTVSTESNVTVGFTTAKSHTPTSHETTEIHTSQVTTAASHTPTSRKTTKIPSSQLTTNTQTTSIISSEIPLTDSTYTLTTKLTTRFINTAETSEQNTAANLEQTSPVVITERPTTEPGGPTTEPGDSANEDDSLDLEQDMPNNGTISDIKDVDTIIFPSFRADIRKRRRERKKFCFRIDFGDIKKSVQCCKKTLNCFDDLPENLDETVFHQGTHHYNEAERLHVCSHIDESIKCKQSVEIKPQCNKAAAVLDKEIKPQMDKIKLFYYNHCNRGTPISPTVNPDPPTLSPRPPTNQDGGSEHYHSNSSNFAPFIGGAVIGVFGLIVIILIALYCRKRMKKSKRRKEQAGDQDRESSQSSRYKTVTYERRRSEVYAEIDEKNMITSVSYDVEGHNCSKQSLCSSGKSRKHAPSTRQEELDNHGYLSPQSIFSEDCLKPDVIPNETNIFTHGYIELKSESGDSAQSYAKLGVEPEDEYVSPDQIQSSPNKDRKSDKLHTYFVLEKENE